MNGRSEAAGEILGIIPARGGSKRFPGKNMAELDGRSLLEHAIAAALGARLLDRVVVSSEDEEILATAGRLRPDLAVKRPPALAQDRSPVLDVVMDVLERLEGQGEGPYRVVAIVQCTSPLTSPRDIDGVIEELLHHPDSDSAATVVRLDHALHPRKLKSLKHGWLYPLWGDDQAMQTAHELDDVYVRNGSVYVSWRDTLERGEIMGARSRGYVMPSERSVDINTPIDLEFAAFLRSRSPGPPEAAS